MQTLWLMHLPYVLILEEDDSHRTYMFFYIDEKFVSDNKKASEIACF